MPRDHQVIHIHPEAPPKPPEGAPCNGCGVCCLAEPCPVGMIVSRKRRGACTALVWSEATSLAPAHYQCGLMLRAMGPGSAHRSGETPSCTSAAVSAAITATWRRLWLAWVRRLISAGRGCDASLVVVADAAGTEGAKADPK
jgi:hypothetical protein